MAITMGKYNTWLELYSAIVSVVVWEIPSDNWLSWKLVRNREVCFIWSTNGRGMHVLGNMYVYEYKYVVPSFCVQ